MNKYQFLVFHLFIAQLAIGQDDYLVTAKGDTLKGKLSFQMVGKIEQVLVKGEKRQTISSVQVRQAFQKGKTYRPVQFSGSVQMMQVITDGYLALMAFQPPGILSYDGRLLLLRDGKMLEVPTLGFKKHVSNFLKDDLQLSSQVKDGALDRADLDKIIAEYNAHIDGHTASSQQQNIVQDKQQSKLEILTELQGEVEQSEMESKKELMEMLVEVKDKITDNKAIPQYLSNALRENLKSKPDLLEKLERLLKDL